MTEAELQALDSHVEKRRAEDATRAGLIREAVERCGFFTPVNQRRRGDEQ
jgi:hypothetical protein